MNKFVIKFWDDNDISRNKIKGALMDLEKRFPHIEFAEISFKELINVDKLEHNCKNIDLLILDLLNMKELDTTDRPNTVGLDILSNLHNLKIETSVIVYSEAVDEKNKEIDFKILQNDYPNVKFQKKSEDISTNILKQLVTNLIVKHLPDQFTLHAGNEIELNQIIKIFGCKELNELLEKLKTKFFISPEEKIELNKMNSGYSGAILFRFNHNNTNYILKLSREIYSLEKEFQNSKNYYPKFPPKFFNSISHEMLYTEEKSAAGIIIKLIENSRTLFNFIEEAQTKEEVESSLEHIYIKNGLKDHFFSQIDGEENWTKILNKFKNGKYIRIETAYKELEPLLITFNNNDIKEFVEKDYFEDFNASKVTKKGGKVLNHNDFHSKNILIQVENTPYIIDTGLMGYSYWVSDLSRLVVDLFITGFDIKTREFYDINHIETNVEIGKKLIDFDTIHYDDKNDRFIDAINWLTSHTSEIHSEYFTIWEFQLGLMREFLTMATRNETVPHSKRALSLELAQYCLEKATINYAS